MLEGYFPKKCKKNVKSFIVYTLSNNPSILILLGLLSGIIPMTVSSGYPIYYALVLSLVINLSVFILTNWKIGIKAVTWCVVGIAIIFYINSQLSTNYSNFLPSRNCGAQIKAIVADSELTDNKTAWLPPPKYIKMTVTGIWSTAENRWIESSGLTSVLLPRGKKRVSYGETLELDGNFIRPQNAPFPGSFDYNKYLKSQGISKIFICSDYESFGLAGFPYNIYRKIYSFRNSALNFLCNGVKTESTKAFLAGFFFGCRQGINSQMKQMFLRSGTIHILAISGLHVGILALILLFILRPLPITPKYIIIPFLLFCYVFLTGFRPSGLRALVMISVFSIHKAFFYSIRPINSIAFAAVIILLLNPFAVNNAGFQFSFIITGFLVLSWEKTNNCLRIIKEKENWLIPVNFTFLKKAGYVFREKILLLAITSTIAGLIGAGLILYYQSLFIPSMILLNILILPFLLPLFIVGFIKIVTFSICGTSLLFLNSLLNGIISIIINIANWGAYSAYTKYYQQPSLISLIIFYILLGGLCITQQKKKVLVFISLIGGIFIIWLSGSIFSSGKITLIQKSGNIPPAIIVKSNSYTHPTLINCPDGCAGIIIDKLRKDGINSLGKIIVTKANKKNSGGVPYLLSQIPIQQLIFPKNIRKTKLYKKIVRLSSKKNIDITYMENDLKNNFILKNIENKIGIEVNDIHPGYKKISINANNKTIDTFEVKNSNYIQIFECSIPKG